MMSPFCAGRFLVPLLAYITRPPYENGGYSTYHLLSTTHLLLPPVPNYGVEPLHPPL